ncbi:TspO/MBR family protein [[Mycobacterium] vasticus]|uniref:TspO/MBR family protein n=1 Tax=[Mycobacterium] vasticus TaxID=2875777 RepID=A0ABU5YZH2_9MYCO|nr:TspO/MBR family protein [Mycolicibacter sp. MYC017]MEB3070246.1 TspO/MBR family protein [Mycolicibacter sp. MYC017]
MRLSTLLGTGAAVAVTAVIGAAATTPEIERDWYQQLRKPPYQPPRQVFPVVWPALYADVAVVSASTIERLDAQGEHKKRATYQAALLINLALNAGWSWLFFNRRRFGPATLVSAALAASSADLTRRAVAVGGGRALPLALYPMWCTFATVLCGHIAVLNRRR